MKKRTAKAGGTKTVTMATPAWPITGSMERKLMAVVVRSGKWSWLGPNERQFCQDYAKFIGTKYCLCLANGTVTMQCALQALGVKPGDEVIVPGLTWVATAQAALDIGADVVLVDIDRETLGIDPAALEKAITRRTKAIIPVHLYGCMADMDAVMRIARKHKLKVVEDVAHQHGSQWRGKGAGSIGDAGSYSFQQSKVLTSGEGGAITCNDPEVYNVCFALKQVGWMPKDPRKSWFDNLAPGNHYGHNYRITEMQAVLLRGGLSRLKAQTEQREEAAAFLRAELARLGGPLLAARRDPRITRQAYYGMTFKYDKAAAGGVEKQTYLQALNDEGAPFGGVYDPVYRNRLLNLYDSTSPVPFRDKKKIQDYRRLKLPNVEYACRDGAVIMGHPALLGARAYLRQIISAVARVNDRLGKLKAGQRK